MASTQPAHRWTYADLCRLPDDGRRYEIIEGVRYEMPSPNADHATAVMNLLLFVLGPVVQARGGRLFTAPLDVFLPGADPVQPDVLVLLPEQLHLLSRRGVEGAPALIAEVLSPSNPEHDLVVKRALYARAGVREYWIVSPEAKTVEVLILEGDRYRTHARVTGHERIASTVLPAVASPAAIVFG